MAKRFTDTTKWDDPWFMELQPEAKLFWLYLLDACDHAGVWKVNWRLAGFMTGLPLEGTTRQQAVDALGDRVTIVESGQYWIIRKFLDFQYGKINPHNKVHNSALKALDRFDQAPIKPLASPLEGAKDKDKDKVTDEVKDKPKKESKDIYTEAFEVFWGQYPRRVGKGNAWKAWQKLSPDDQVQAWKKIPEQAKAWHNAETETRFIPHPATWLNGRRWEDETPGEAPAKCSHLIPEPKITSRTHITGKCVKCGEEKRIPRNAE